MKKGIKSVTNFLFEVGILAKTPRSGFHFLGTGDQTVAEHLNRSTYMGYVLTMLEGNADLTKVLKMCMLHDLAEGRISDLNYVHQKYVSKAEDKAIEDAAKTLPFGEDIMATIHEYEERKSKEALIAKDADNLEWIFSLKEQFDTGNSRAKSWIELAVKRLKTKSAKLIVSEMMSMDSNDWWDSKDGPARQVDWEKHHMKKSKM